MPKFVTRIEISESGGSLSSWKNCRRYSRKPVSLREIGAQIQRVQAISRTTDVLTAYTLPPMEAART